MYRDELRKTLLSIDEEASLLLGDSGERLDVILVGGGALILRELTGRTVTHDIDVFEMNAQLREIISNYPEVNENTAVYCSQMPYNYPDRLCELDIPTQLVRYLTPLLGRSSGHETVRVSPQRHCRPEQRGIFERARLGTTRPSC